MFIFRYSGLIVIFFAWIFLVLPFWVAGKRHKHVKLVSEMSSLTFYNSILTVGIIGATFFQIVFALYIVSVISGWFSKFGVALFVIGSVLFGLAGYFTLSDHKNIHNALVTWYVILMFIGNMFISVASYNLSPLGSVICVAALLTMIVGGIRFYKANKPAFSELWVIIFSNLWALTLYLFIL